MTATSGPNNPTPNVLAFTNNPLDFPRDLRYIFVQLLFSLTAAEIARQTARLILNGPPALAAVAAYSHLFLAFVIVTTSWVGWAISESSRSARINSVFSWEFTILLVDVVLVLLYFILVQGAEVPKWEDSSEAKNSITPSSKNEVTTVGLIFIGYFLWDILTKACVRVADENRNFLKRLHSGKMRDRGKISFVCMCLAILAWMFLGSASSQRQVLMVDSSLVFLVLFFRAWKEGRRNLAIAFSIAAALAGLLGAVLV